MIDDPLRTPVIPLAEGVEAAVEWLVRHLEPVFFAAKVPVAWLLNGFESCLLSVPPTLLVLALGVVAWRMSSFQIAFMVSLSGVLIAMIGVWEPAMNTLSIALTAVVFCLSMGVPLGILAARSDRFAMALRPVLDAMQTTPSFVYLVPIVMLFGIGKVPGVIVTIIYGMPPVIRLTNLAIRQVDQEIVEAATAFGATQPQLLFKVQLPLALPTIMAGVNQTIMMALSMTVVSSMIGVAGLGQMVIRGLGRLDIGLAAMGGCGVVLLAVLLDRFSQAVGFAVGRKRRSNVRPLLHSRMTRINAWFRGRTR